MAKRTASLLAGIASALGAIGFEVALPDPPAADPLALADTAVRLRELGQVLADDRDGLQKRLADHRRQYDELSAQILALTG